MQWNPGCAVTSSVPAFTYASRLPVTRQPAGVLVEVGYMEYLASMPPPVISITYKSVPLFTSLAPLIRFAVVSPYYGSFTLQLGSHRFQKLHHPCHIGLAASKSSGGSGDVSVFCHIIKNFIVFKVYIHIIFIFLRYIICIFPISQNGL